MKIEIQWTLILKSGEKEKKREKKMKSSIAIHKNTIKHHDDNLSHRQRTGIDNLHTESANIEQKSSQQDSHWLSRKWMRLK